MAKAIFTDSNLGLGCFSLPILNFYNRYKQLEKTNPTLKAKASTVYFGMLAEQPQPTSQKMVNYFVYNEPEFKYGALSKDKWLEAESHIRFDPLVVSYKTQNTLGSSIQAATGDDSYGGRVTGYMMPSKYRQSVEMVAAEAYIRNLNKLQEWMIYNGLWDEVKKTLAEESRKLQAQAAAIQESKAAAARALAYNRITEEMNEQQRQEAIQEQARANERMDEALAKEAKVQQQIKNVENGLPPDYKEEESSSGIIPLAIAAAAAYFAFGG